jgi:hypothetical protein
MKRGRRGNGVGKGVERAIKVKEGDGVEAEQEGTAEGGEKVEGGIRGGGGTRNETKKNKGVTIDGDGGRRGKRGEGIEDGGKAHQEAGTFCLIHGEEGKGEGEANGGRGFKERDAPATANRGEGACRAIKSEGKMRRRGMERGGRVRGKGENVRGGARGKGRNGVGKGGGREGEQGGDGRIRRGEG